ncbi:MAG: energy transducer TonB [Nitrospinae bacterium]|nr:energy transducer TonB [Nitrospinota bacterium]
MLRDHRFLRALAASVIMHASLFVWVSLAPSQPKYRFFGSGTAVSLVGADEIPGGSARGKSGDRLEDLEAPVPQKGPDEGTKKITAPEKKPAPAKVKKKKVVKKKPPKEVRRIKAKKDDKSKKIVRKKKKRDPVREARLKRIRDRRERARRWRNRFKKNEGKTPVKPKKRPRDDWKSDDRLAKADLAPKSRAPLKGYAGEGGGDGQGGGSRAGGSGGVARTDKERYYGLLAERIRGFWTVPPGIADLSRLKTDVAIDVDRGGNYRNLRVVRYSGNHIYDQAALRAVQRAAEPSLPKPPDTIRENWLLLGFRFCGRDFCR